MRQCYAQNYADKNYYLVDSLDLSKLENTDSVMLDSCLNIFHTSKKEDVKVSAIEFIAEESWNPNVWTKYNDWVYEYSKKRLKDKLTKQQTKSFRKKLSATLNNKGYYENQIGNPSIALKYFSEALKIDKFLNDKKGVAQIYNNIGGVYLDLGKLKFALNNFEKSLKIREEINDSLGISQTLANIGQIYYDLGDIQGVKYLERSLNYVKESDYIQLGFIYNNIAGIHTNTGNYKLGYEYYLKSLEMNKKLGRLNGQAQVLSNIGTIVDKEDIIPCEGNELICKEKKKYIAIEYYQKSIDIYKQTGHLKPMLTSINNIGTAYYKLGKLNKALEYSMKSFRLADSIGYSRPIRNAAEALYLIYEKKKNYKESFKMYKLFIKMNDSLKNEENQKAAIQQQAKYEYEKQKSIDDAEHEKQIAIEQEAKEKQTILTYSTAGGLGLVGIFLLVVFNRLKVTRKQKNIIEEQKQEVEQQKEEVELAHSELEEKNKEITDSIQYAKRIQNAILPPSKLVKEYLQESFIYYKPKDIVAGDFYWLEQKDNKILFAAADCTGHGVPGAMVSVICNNGLNRSVREYGLTDPGEILNKTREIVVQEFEKSEEEVKDGMDIALCSLQLNSPFERGGRGMTLKYAGAHNPLWIIRPVRHSALLPAGRHGDAEFPNKQIAGQARNDDFELLETKANKQPIGQFDNPEPYITHTIELETGDSVYIFSDGYADQFGGEKGKKLKSANFKKLLLSIQKETMEKQKQLIDEAFEKWKGDLEQLDDVCVIGVKI